MMLAGVSGYNCTGSSAVIDLLKEYEGVSVCDSEVMFIYAPDGLMDLERAINESGTYLTGDVAIRRYKNLCKHIELPKTLREQFVRISNDFVDNLTDVTWRGYSSYDRYRENGINYLSQSARYWLSCVIYHFFKKKYNGSYRKMYLSFNEKDFEKKAFKYLKDIEKLFLNGKELAIINQFFSAYSPLASIKYTPSAKLIVVDRDPRDVYITERLHKDTICFPTEDVNKFIEYQKKCWSRENELDSDNILRIQFEDLVYNYEESVDTIEKFLGIVGMHTDMKKYFNPDVSINNTQLFLRFPEFSAESEIIKKELNKYIYDYPYKRMGTNDFF